MTSRRTTAFTAVRTEGALLPAELLHRIARLDPSLTDVDGASFKLGTDERIQDAIQRAWTRLRAAWAPFRAALNAAPPAEAATALTREKWLLPLFAELGFGRLAAARAVEKDGKSFPVSHGWGSHVALHLVGARVPLDVRTGGVAGAARTTPHGLVQELLNRSDDHLWAVVTNGLQLRLLRDNVSLTRLAFVEFDLAALFDGESYADFVVLFLLLHVSRFGEGRPDDCPLERWAAAAKTQGTRALDRLRDGVQDAITALGAGFVGEPRNTALKERLRSGALPALDYYRQVLRLVYRLLFLFVAEDRDLLFAPDAPEPVRERFRRWYSTERLRRLAARRGGTPHGDLWRQFRLVVELLGKDEGGPALGLPALGSFLFSSSAAPDLDGAELPNRAFLEALRALTLVEENGVRRFVDWKNLGAEELGSVYESLLELHPEINADAGEFKLGSAGGNERKTTGSYYTPDSLIQCLLDSALDSVLAEAARATDPEAAILALKVCDPACGSGHFLIAAAHRIAKRLAAARTGDDEPPPESVRRALRDVIGRCLYGIDLNEMAVELCKVNLWMEALEPGRPLSFLDAKILHGNALLGTTPALIAKGVPDEAFEPITGDSKEVARALKRQNKSERSGQGELFGLFAAEPAAEYRAVESAAAAVATLPDASLASVRAKEARWRALRETPEYRQTALVADAWTAAFVWPKQNGAPPAPTHAVFEKLRAGEALPPATAAEVARITADYRFLHWHTAFPEVFRAPAPNAPPENPECGWSGGFDVVLGNPPWERVKLQEQEWFAVRSPEIASAPNAAARKRLIAELRTKDPTLFAAFEADLRRAEGESHLIRNSERFPLCGRGDVNTYAVFAETNRTLLSPRGRVGCIVPSGIATDDTTKHFFADMVERGSLVSIFDFENSVGMFEGVGHGRFKFCLLTVAGRARKPGTESAFAFYLKYPADHRNPERCFTLSAANFALLNPNTRTCPVFRSRRDAEITKSIYARVPVLIREGPPELNPWSISFSTMFHMSSDSGRFRTREQLTRDGFRLEGNHFVSGDDRFLPLYEAKMLHHFDHRYGDYDDQPEDSESTALQYIPPERLADPAYAVRPRYWVPVTEVNNRLADRWPHQWLLGFRDITNATNERTVIASVIPRVGVGHKAPLLIPRRDARSCAAMMATLNCLALDFVGRQKVGGTNLAFFILKQLAVLSPDEFDVVAAKVVGPFAGTVALRSAPAVEASSAEGGPAPTILDWIVPRVVELVYTANDVAPFARDCGYEGPPFRWDEERRFRLRCELDAAFFRLYGLPRDDVAYVLDTFPIVRRHDEQRHGTYRTKDSILALFDEMSR